MQTQEEDRVRAQDDTHAGPSRRTVLAAERTWLAWWRTGIAAAGASIAVGGLIPRLVQGSRWAFVTLGVGYALLALAIFVLAFVRHREIAEALAAGVDVHTGRTWMLVITVAGGVLAVGTLLVVLFAD